ncbi:MAG TPA: TonB family protein [Candidatus Sulfotelmatobacter sp.]|nr:TonB family protein [Candidatus Sulfotelmatobacter sp.]
MGYSALLFCPEEKTARTVTQVLSELDFTVEACTEPFAAVKKLMGQHFDAVVVDCDNEQNATLLFKSARNSTSNQTSLAVAVVEGQAGVAKAFRIGANLVLTKPINIEQSKGTLRVARGLLRKGEPVKGGATAATPAVPAPKPPAQKAEPNPGPAAAAPQVTSPLTPERAPLPAPKPIPAWPAAAVASTKPAAQDDDLLDIDTDVPKKAATASASHPAMDLFAEPSARPTAKMPGTGAASAPAPAREPAQPIKQAEAATALSSPALETSGTAPTGVVGSAPSFTFGGTTDTEDEPSGGGKKLIIGIAAAAVVALGIYLGVNHFRGSASETANVDTTPLPSSVSQPVANTPKPNAQPEKPSAISTPNAKATPSEPNKIQSIIDEAAGDTHSAKDATHKSLSETSEEEELEPKPIMVKGGKLSTHAKTAETPAPAPTMIGLASPNASAPPAGLIPTTTPALRPTLSTVNVSQGVSTGLLIKKVAPSYPPNALRMRVEGNVELQATISKDGQITHIKVLSGNSQLTKAATDAVKQWKYKPYLLNGEPVEIQTQVTVKFKLPQ